MNGQRPEKAGFPPWECGCGTAPFRRQASPKRSDRSALRALPLRCDPCPVLSPESVGGMSTKCGPLIQWGIPDNPGGFAAQDSVRRPHSPRRGFGRSEYGVARRLGFHSLADPFARVASWREVWGELPAGSKPDPGARSDPRRRGVTRRRRGKERGVGQGAERRGEEKPQERVRPKGHQPVARSAHAARCGSEHAMARWTTPAMRPLFGVEGHSMGPVLGPAEVSVSTVWANVQRPHGDRLRVLEEASPVDPVQCLHGRRAVGPLVGTTPGCRQGHDLSLAPSVDPGI